MKRLFFLLAVVTFLFGKPAFAQPPQFNIHYPNIAACSNVEITLYAVQAGTCTIVGISNPITVTPGTNTSLFAPYTGIWSLDPSTCGCTWEFIAADVKSVCPGSPSGIPTCPNWDAITVGMPHCGYFPDDCFDYSVGCSSCLPGDMRHAHFGGGHIHID